MGAMIGAGIGAGLVVIDVGTWEGGQGRGVGGRRFTYNSCMRANLCPIPSC